MKPVQITYITAGNGHKTAAMALREALNARNVPNVVTDIFNFSNTVFRWSYSDAYDFISEHSHLACRFVYELLDRDRNSSGVVRLVEKLRVNNVKGFMRFMEENMPDVALCTHYFPANVLSRMKEQDLYRGRIYTVVTDYGLHKLWKNDCVDGYFVAGDWVRDALLEMGVERERIVLSGIPVLRKYAALHPEAAGTAPQTPTPPPPTLRPPKEGLLSVLFVTSAIPDNQAIRIMRDIFDAAMPLALTVVTGRNRDLLRKIDDMDSSETVVFRKFGFVNNLQELMAEADVMITKPGGLTVSEALCAGVPLLLVNPIPYQELYNAAYLQEKGAGILAPDEADVVTYLRLLCADEGKRREMRRNALAIAAPLAADVIAEAITSEGVCS